MLIIGHHNKTVHGTQTDPMGLPRIPAQQLEWLRVVFAVSAFPSHYWSTAGEHASSFQCFIISGILR